MIGFGREKGGSLEFRNKLQECEALQFPGTVSATFAGYGAVLNTRAKGNGSLPWIIIVHCSRGRKITRCLIFARQYELLVALAMETDEKICSSRLWNIQRNFIQLSSFFSIKSPLY